MRTFSLRKLYLTDNIFREKLLGIVMSETMFVKLIGAIGWPMVATLAMFVFRTPLIAALARLRKVGPAELEPIAQQAPQAVESVATPEPTVVAAPPGSILGNSRKLVEDIVQKVPEGSRTKQLQDVLATAVVSVQYEQFNFLILGSQLNLLRDLNSTPLPRKYAETIYTMASANEPGFFSAYTFQQWLDWLKLALLVDQNGDLLHLTYDGREFFKYVVSRGYILVRPH
jgi:hypothetical protein